MNDDKLTDHETALLEIIIREIQDALPNIDEVTEIINVWITANNLHPEDVIVVSREPEVEP